MIKDFFKLAFKNLFRRKIRSWLTMVGIFIGIMAVVALIGLGQGLQEGVNKQFVSLGTDKIIITPKGSAGSPGGVASVSNISRHDKDVIKRVNGVDNVAGLIFKNARIEFNNEVYYGYTLGLPQDQEKSLADGFMMFEPVAGRNLKSGDKYKAYVGYDVVYGKLFTRAPKLGDKIIVEGKQFEIIGVNKKIGDPNDDKAVYMSKETAMDLYSMDEEIYGYIAVKTKPDANPDVVAEDISRAMKKDRGLDKGDENFEVQTAGQLMKMVGDILNIIQVVLIGIAAISLIVGGVGIMNTMYTSVLERTKEVGVMKAIGAKNSDILKLFLIESGLLGMVGGAIGILLGVVLGKSVEIIATQAMGTNWIQAYFPWYLILGALMFSFLIGTLSGLTPALQAARMKPADSLRYE